MGLVLKNNAVSRLAGSLSPSSTQLSVTVGDGEKFPSLAAGDWFPLTVISEGGMMEIMRCTARAGGIFDVTRAQEGTIALSFSAGDRVELRLTEAALAQFLREDQVQASPNEGVAGQILTVGGFGIGDAGSAPQISSGSAQSAATPSGLYRALGESVGSPGGHAGEGFLRHQTNGSTLAVQEFIVPASPIRIFRRAFSASAWSAWAEVYHDAILTDMASDLVPYIKDLSRYTLNSAATTTTLDLGTTQVFRIDATVNRTLTFANPPAAGRAMAVVITLTGNKVITWPAGIRWNGGVAPALSASWTVITLVWDGSVWSGSVGGRG